MNDHELLRELFNTFSEASRIGMRIQIAADKAMRAEREADEGRSVGLPQDAMADALDKALDEHIPPCSHRWLTVGWSESEEANIVECAMCQETRLFTDSQGLHDERRQPWNDDLNPQ